MEEQEEQLNSTRYEGWQDNVDTLRLRLDPSPKLEEIRHMLLNEMYDQKQRTWVPIPGLEPRMTKEGVEKLMTELYARMSIDTVLSYLKEKRIMTIVREVGLDVIRPFLWYNSKKYKINKGERDSIRLIIMHNIEMFLKRAKDGFENKGIYKSMDYKEVAQRSVRDNTPMEPQQQQRMPGFGSFMRGRMR